MAAICWAPSLAFAWRAENDGQPLHNDANDPGGDTSWGVTAATWATAVQHGYVEGSLQDANQGQLGLVLHSLFWNAVQGDALPAGLDQVVFDMGMVSGPGRAARILQKCVGATQDGQIGPKTLAAVAAMDAAALVHKMTTFDEDFFASLSTFTYFGKGWDRRATDCQADALSRIGST